MRAGLTTLTCAVFLVTMANAATTPKTHNVVLGHPTTIYGHADNDAVKSESFKIRALYVDGRVKEFTIGGAHDVTERTFVVQRIYRVNDSLPQENGPSKWRWQLGGWLLVDRTSGKVQQIPTPDLDPETSVVSWFRDYAAYCGISEDGQKVSAVLIELGRRKPLLKKIMENSGPTCVAPVWDRGPVRVTFQPTSDRKFTFVVNRGAAGEVIDTGQLAAADGDDGE